MAKRFLAAILLSSFLSPLEAEEAESIGWRVETRALEFDGWRARWALAAEGGGWLGGSHLEIASRDLLWQLDDGRLESVPLPTAAARAYVLDVDPTGGLWLAIYNPGQTSTYDALTIARHIGEAEAADRSESWHLETVTPGIWPQAMAMAGPDHGWIGGNHTRLLERTPEGWRASEIELLPWVERRNSNVLDLALTQDVEGFLVGTPGLVARLKGGVWRQLEVPASLVQQYLTALDLTADGSVWICSSEGHIARWHPKQGWRVERPTSFALMGIDMVSEEEGWAVGKAGTLLERRGGRWQQVASPVAADLYDVAMEDPSHGWIAGHRVVLRGAPVKMTWPLAERTPATLAGRVGLGVAVADLDRDGRVELLLAGHDEVRIFRRGPGGWNLGPVLPRPESPFVQRHDGWAVADANGDGAADILLLGAHGAERHLYLNDGAGAFVDATVEAGLGPFPGFANTAFWIDLDVDGDLDLQVSRGTGAWPLFGRLYVNDGFGRFSAHPLESIMGVPDQTVLGGDLDGDGDTDLVSLDPPRLHRNDGGALVVMVLAKGLPEAAGSVTAGALVDLDLDGDLDVVWAGERLEILRNDGFGQGGAFVLTDSVEAALSDARAVFCRAGDLDHDGYPELLVHWRGVGEASTQLLSRGAEGNYRAVDPSVSPFAGLGPLDDAVLADLDGDGDLDSVLTGPRGTLLLEGRLSDRRGLRIRLHGDRGSVLGTTVKVREAGSGAEDPARPLLASLRASSDAGVLGEVHAGFGDALRVDVEVEFPAPARRRVELRDVPAGSLLDVYDTAMPQRKWIRGQRAMEQRLAKSDLRLEGLKLSALLVIVTVLWGFSRRRPAAGSWNPSSADSAAHDALRRLQRDRRRASVGLLLLLHLAFSLALTPDERLWAHIGQVLGLASLTALFLTLERRQAARHVGPYRLGALLGEGGMGAVYRARHQVRGQHVALKLLHSRLLRDEVSGRRFLREARLMASVDHPSLVRVEEAGEIDGRAFIAMELLEGGSMAKYLADHGPLSASDWRAASQALAEALAALHERGVCHRDLKSENVFVLAEPADDWSQRVRLMDLGLAWSESQATLTREHALVGTLATMAPERLRGHRADPRSDLWSLGVVLYEMATGQLPFVAKDVAGLTHAILTEDPIWPSSSAAALPPSHQALILDLLASEPMSRPEDAQTVARILGSDLETALLKDFGGPVESELLASAPSSVSDPWLRLYASARAHFAAGRLNQADVALVACLQALRQRAAGLEEQRRTAYLARPDVQAVLEFSQHLEHRHLEPPGLEHETGSP